MRDNGFKQKDYEQDIYRYRQKVLQMVNQKFDEIEHKYLAMKDNKQVYRGMQNLKQEVDNMINELEGLAEQIESKNMVESIRKVLVISIDL